MYFCIKEKNIKMIHISDVEKRLKDNPEPNEVKEIRENIIESFSRLKFVEDGHKYYVHNDDGTKTELRSVSHFCHQFSPYVDWDEICENKAKKMGIPYETLKRQWRENNLRSTNNGTKTHFYGENMMLFIQGRFDEIDESIKNQIEDGFFVPYGKKEEAISNFYEDILKIDNFYPVMAEAKLYTGINDTLSLKENFSGTFDMLFAFKHNGKFKLSILDFKTNNQLENDFNRNKGNMLLPPFEDLVDEPKSNYTLQLSMYQLGVEQLGYEVVDRKLIWLKDDGTYEKVSVQNVTDRLKLVL